jgi:hypothetical protein
MKSAASRTNPRQPPGVGVSDTRASLHQHNESEQPVNGLRAAKLLEVTP